MRLALPLLLIAAAAHAQTPWRPPPTPAAPVEIHGVTDVTVPPGVWLAGELRIGTHRGDQTAIDINGGELVLLQNSLFIGDESGSRGELTLNSGALHSVMDVFVGAATASTRRANDAALHIRGGAFLGRTLSIGFGYGSHALVAIEGSTASAVHVFDYVDLEAIADPAVRPGIATLSFTIDEHGVTPITIQSRAQGLRIHAVAPSRCQLQIALRAVPPREDITLVSAKVPTRGAFDGLPEGADITADYTGHTYRWQLTYRGGPNHTDLVLLNRSTYPDDAPVTHTRALPQSPAPLWRDHPAYPLAISSSHPAFPGAEGYGAFSQGGAEGPVIFVDNLNDSGPGSLRAAVDAEGPRTIAFRVAGAIALRTPLEIRHPFLTLDAQRAPALGITITGHGLRVATHDVVLRHFRIRVGDAGVAESVRYEAGEGEDGLRFEDAAKDVIADHLSLSWTTGKIVVIAPMADRITVQWCILSESLNFAGHGYAALAGGNRVTWHHNLLAHNYSRNVRFQGPLNADFRNNVIYDWGDAAGYGEFDRLNYIGNYLKPGPSTTQSPRSFHRGDATVLPNSIYLEGNVMEGDPKVTADNWRGMAYYYYDRAILKAVEPFPAPAPATESAEAAYAHVLNEAGATQPVRDSVDTRIVREVREGTGRIILRLP